MKSNSHKWLDVLIKILLIGPILIVGLLFSFSVGYYVPNSEFDNYLAEYLFPASSVLVGIAIASAGIFLGAALSFYSVRVAVNSNHGVVGTEKINRIRKSLQDDVLISIICFVLMLSLPQYKLHGIMWFEWCFIDVGMSRVQIINSGAVFLVFLLSLSIFDITLTSFMVVRDMIKEIS